MGNFFIRVMKWVVNLLQQMTNEKGLHEMKKKKKKCDRQSVWNPVPSAQEANVLPLSYKADSNSAVNSTICCDFRGDLFDAVQRVP